MKIRECTSEDVISLLQCAKDNDETEMFDSWEQHQKWILDAVYGKNHQVLIADGGYGVIGYLIWSLYKIYYKWEANLTHIFILPDFRGQGIGDKLVLQFIHSCYSSSAQRLKFNTKVLPQRWIDEISMNAPYEKYQTYYFERTEEIKRYYNENIRKIGN